MEMTMSKPLALCIATIGWPGWDEGPNQWNPLATNGPYPQYIANFKDSGRSYPERLNDCLRESTAPIVGFLHDDLYIYEQGWDERILKQFDDPDVAVAAVFGASGHGTPDLYEKNEFVMGKMARVCCLSNMRDAETHGKRFTGECDISVLDMMAAFVRRDFLESIGGWPEQGPCIYDYWICCEARRHHKRIRLVGVDCAHLSNGSYQESKKLGIYAYQDHPEDGLIANRKIWEEYRDVLPAWTEPK